MANKLNKSPNRKITNTGAGDMIGVVPNEYPLVTETRNAYFKSLENSLGQI